MRAKRTPPRLFLRGCKAEMRLARFRAYRIWQYHNGLGLIALRPVATVTYRLVLGPQGPHRQGRARQPPRLAMRDLRRSP
jgi:hypothetical protein